MWLLVSPWLDPLEHDSPLLLFRLACEYLISTRVIRPGPVTVIERVAHAREAARRETFDRLADEFTDQRCADLDNLLVNDPAIGTTRLRWLATGPVEASPAAVKAEVAKLVFLRGLDAHTLDLSVLPAERRRFLATVGRRLTAQALQRREPQRRYPILLTLLAVPLRPAPRRQARRNHAGIECFSRDVRWMTAARWGGCAVKDVRVTHPALGQAVMFTPAVPSVHCRRMWPQAWLSRTVHGHPRVTGAGENAACEEDRPRTGSCLGGR